MPLRCKLDRRRTIACAVATLSLAMLSCGQSDLVNTISGAALNQTVLNRGNILIGFINNTNARAIFTFGGYDQLNENATPVFSQLRLNAATASSTITQACHRTFAIGTPDLIRLVNTNGHANITDSAALVTGVNFSTAPANDPLAAAPTEGTAAPLTVQNGIDYTCEGLLLFSFEQDAAAAGGFRIDFRFIPRG